ncbi:MAG: hypothetical protein IJY38_00940 [Clostridia bacterium]|nr:hypothetical protein [Clostridia bacterium]
MKTLRIISAILSSIAIAAVIPLFALTEAIYGVTAIVVALGFACLMMVFKRAQERKEKKDLPPEPDFFTPTEENKDEPNE